MKHLNRSFQEKLGIRGVHAYTEDDCRFLPWTEVVAFLNKLPEGTDPEFFERLLTTLANYNPDTEFLAVQRLKDTVSIELYSLQ
jgi:hypothetical protein